MMAQLLFTTNMIATMIVLLGWLVSGGMHRSAHPNGERPHFAVFIEGWNYDPGSLIEGQLPHGYLFIGPAYSTGPDWWRIDLGWDYRPSASPYELDDVKGWTLRVLLPRRRHRRWIAVGRL